MQRFRVATFNLFNLVLPETTYYGRRRYTQEEYRRKLDWVAGQLRHMDADLVGFQEVFHEAALREALDGAGGYPEDGVVVDDRDGSLPSVALASRFPIVETEIIKDFPPEASLDFGEVVIPVRSFSRPVLRVRVRLPGDVEPDLFVVHLKSKRPEVPEGVDPHDPLERAKGKVRSLLIRALEAAALRALLLPVMQGSRRPLIVLGDANDTGAAMTTEVLMGTPPWRQLPFEVKQRIWDVLLYDVKDAQGPRRRGRDVSFTHIHNGAFECLDHILVSQEFIRANRRHVGYVEYVADLNDHLIDSTLSREPPPVWTSDHGQVVATLVLRAKPSERSSVDPV